MTHITLYLLLFISTSLIARENPFVPTQTYQDEKEILLEVKNKIIKTPEIVNEIVSKK